MPSNNWDPILWCSVNELELEPSTKCLLHAARISFLGELVQQTEKNLLRLPEFAESDLKQVKEALAQRCLELGAVLDFWPIPPIKSTG